MCVGNPNITSALLAMRQNWMGDTSSHQVDSKSRRFERSFVAHVHLLPFIITSVGTIMSLHSVNSFGRPLSLISAALLLHICGAVAADAPGDVQQQIRAVLAGRIAIESAPSPEGHDDSTEGATANSQELPMRSCYWALPTRASKARARLRRPNVWWRQVCLPPGSSCLPMVTRRRWRDGCFWVSEMPLRRGRDV